MIPITGTSHLESQTTSLLLLPCNRGCEGLFGGERSVSVCLCGDEVCLRGWGVVIGFWFVREAGKSES